MSKKRGGILRHRPGERDRYATTKKSDVPRFLELAGSEPDPSRAAGYRIAAQVAHIFERINKRLGVNNRGRPAGATGEQRYTGMIEAMAKIAETTGEQKDHTLAKMAAEAGHAPESVTQGAAIKQAAILWKRHIQKK